MVDIMKRGMPPDPEAFESQQEAVREALRASGLPIVVLNMTALPDGQLAGLESWDGNLTAVEIVYSGPQPSSPWISVTTARWIEKVDPGPLDELVGHHIRNHGERITGIEWSENGATVSIDGMTVAGRLLRAGDRWWGIHCGQEGVEITIVARDWVTASIVLRTLPDVERPLLATRRILPEPRQPAPSDVVEEAWPGTLSQDPHRALVDVNLQYSRELAEWQEMGGPGPKVRPYLPALWRAAVQRHMTLTDTGEPVAREQVASVVDHLCNLQRATAWFRENEALRERAISETLLFGTRLGTDVLSREAQIAWEQMRGIRLPIDYGEVMYQGATQQRWIESWNAWASSCT